MGFNPVELRSRTSVLDERIKAESDIDEELRLMRERALVVAEYSIEVAGDRLPTEFNRERLLGMIARVRKLVSGEEPFRDETGKSDFAVDLYGDIQGLRSRVNKSSRRNMFDYSGVSGSDCDATLSVVYEAVYNEFRNLNK